MTLARRRLVRVPASSANLGPGFDVLAAALSPALELEVVETGTFAIRTELDVAQSGHHVVQGERAARAARSKHGVERSRGQHRRGIAVPRERRYALRHAPSSPELASQATN